MKIVMDSDCLIKLTKAGLKEKVCQSMMVFIPGEVKRETVDQASGLPDALRIGENIEARMIHVSDTSGGARKGEDAVLDLYRSGGFDAIGSDDHRFLRHLKGLGVPFAVPAALIILMTRHLDLNRREAEDCLFSLKPYISEEQYAVAMITIGQERNT